MFLDNVKEIVKKNKEKELGKWIFGINEKFELTENIEVQNFIQKSLQTLKEKVYKVKNPLFYTDVKNNNFNNVISDFVCHPLAMLNLDNIEELTDDEKSKLDILILYKVLFITIEKSSGTIFITNEDLPYDFNNYDNNEHVRNYIKNEVAFDKYIIVIKTGELYKNDNILKYLNI